VLLKFYGSAFFQSSPILSPTSFLISHNEKGIIPFVSRQERQPPGELRFTKKQRRNRAREARRAEEGRQRSRIRAILAAASALSVPAAFIGIVALSQNHDPGLTTPISTSGIVRTETPEVTKQDEQMLIQRAVEKRGIKLSQREQKLWQGFGPLPPIDDQSTAPEVTRRFRETLNRMSQSKNPYFQESAALLTSLLNKRDANVIIGRNVIFPGESVATTVNAIYLSNKIQWNIAISKDQLLRGHPLDLPLSLTHDARLINNQIAFIKGLGSSQPMQEKLALAKQRFNTPNALLLEEMSGYAAQAEAHIYALGLMGNDRALTRSDHDTITLGFIRSGENFESPEWKSFLLMRYPKMLKGWSLN